MSWQYLANWRFKRFLPQHQKYTEHTKRCFRPFYKTNFTLRFTLKALARRKRYNQTLQTVCLCLIIYFGIQTHHFTLQKWCISLHFLSRTWCQHVNRMYSWDYPLQQYLAAWSFVVVFCVCNCEMCCTCVLIVSYDRSTGHIIVSAHEIMKYCALNAHVVVSVRLRVDRSGTPSMSSCWHHVRCGCGLRGVTSSYVFVWLDVSQRESAEQLWRVSDNRWAVSVCVTSLRSDSQTLSDAQTAKGILTLEARWPHDSLIRRVSNDMKTWIHTVLFRKHCLGWITRRTGRKHVVSSGFWSGRWAAPFPLNGQSRSLHPQGLANLLWLFIFYNLFYFL